MQDIIKRSKSSCSRCSPIFKRRGEREEEGKEEKEEEELFVWSTSSHSTTALFFAALRGTLAYREPCWRMYDPRVPRGSPSSIRGRWTLSVPRGKNLFRRGRRGSLSAEARRAEDVLTSTRRSPWSPRVCSRGRVERRRGYRSRLLPYEFTLHSTCRGHEDEKRVPRTARQTRPSPLL